MCSLLEIYNLHCKDCGGLTTFVDDSTYQVSASNTDDLSEKLTSQYRKLSDYMGDTGLVINYDKTHLIEGGEGGSWQNVDLQFF